MLTLDGRRQIRHFKLLDDAGSSCVRARFSNSRQFRKITRVWVNGHARQSKITYNKAVQRSARSAPILSHLFPANYWLASMPRGG